MRVEKCSSVRGCNVVTRPTPLLVHVYVHIYDSCRYRSASSRTSGLRAPARDAGRLRRGTALRLRSAELSEASGSRPSGPQDCDELARESVVVPRGAALRARLAGRLPARLAGLPASPWRARCSTSAPPPASNSRSQCMIKRCHRVCMHSRECSPWSNEPIRSRIFP